jgi:hypothetical protein
MLLNTSQATEMLLTQDQDQIERVATCYITACSFAAAPAGMLQPARTWCFVGEIVRDTLSNMPVLGHRVEVRDITGAVHSIMFYPTSGRLDYSMVCMDDAV